MRLPILLFVSIVAVLLLSWLPVSRADTGEVAVLDGPRGNWLATVRADASLEVLEERDGWRRVRLEGWIAGAAGSGAPAASGTVAAAPTPTPAADRGVTVSGVLLPTAAEQSATPGAGLVVLLVGALDALDEEHARAGQECRDALAESQHEVDARRDDYRKQMNSTDNFKEAAQRNDRARKALQEAERAQRERLEACRRTADQLFQAHAVRRAISDMAGRFEFDHVPGGSYRILASEIGGEAPRAWAFDCLVTGDGPVVIDPQTDRSDMLPYWGLDRSDGS
ncbi:MAG TPA: hypothetical protein VFG08_07770 [Candidatus Polarisedimenticolia bacterium]|nr:hypothetical protein [Candidatus Polarisedimenticolia bacterium]